MTTQNKKTVAKKTVVKKTVVKKVNAIVINVPTQQPKGGKALFAYTHSVLITLGMLTTGRKSAPNKVFKAFYATNTAFNYHKGCGNFELVDNGKFRLTVQGYNKFAGRLAGKEKGQEIDMDVVNKILDYFKTGKADKDSLDFIKAANASKGGHKTISIML